jgi:hypothetical protein
MAVSMKPTFGGVMMLIEVAEGSSRLTMLDTVAYPSNTASFCGVGQELSPLPLR